MLSIKREKESYSLYRCYLYHIYIPKHRKNTNIHTLKNINVKIICASQLEYCIFYTKAWCFLEHICLFSN